MANMTARYNDAYNVDEYFNDLKKGIFKELPTKAKIEPYRRNLQKSYVERMLGILNPSSGGAAAISIPGFTVISSADMKKNDVSSVTRAHLSQLRTEILNAASGNTDNMSKYHLQDLAERIKQGLDPR